MVKIEDLILRLTEYNRAYRKGHPIVSDEEYDKEVELLRSLDPLNMFLRKVEPEEFKGRVKVAHPFKMLSIQKVYSTSRLERFVRRVQKEAKEASIHSSIVFKLTAKLDGLAGNDNGKLLVSRGDGRFGYDISSAFLKGVIPIGGRGKGLGEIVVVKSYFKEHLTKFFQHPRNMVVGIVASEKLNVNAKKALDKGKIHFVPYSQMKSILVSGEELLEKHNGLYKTILKGTDYPTDGVVVEVTNNILRGLMGSTTHHYRWQAAIKTKGEIAETLVKEIIWQVGRSGIITPVLQVEPIHISGANIKRVTAHNAGNIRNLGIGVGSVIRIIRSGEIIPKLESVLKTNGSVEIPTLCPICHAKLNWENLFLKCSNDFCVARVTRSIVHWFRTLGNTDWMGIKTVNKIVNGGYSSLESVYKLNDSKLLLLGFTSVQSRNLCDAIQKSISNPVDDWRFLAAFGIPGLGLGDSNKLLREFSIYEVTSLKKEMIMRIGGFGRKTSKLIEDGIRKIRNTILNMTEMKFNLLITPFINERSSSVNSNLFGKKIVFTGKMKTGQQNKLKSEAVNAGVEIKNTVTNKTNYLVCGFNGSKSKIQSAKNKGITILTEKQYLDLIDGNSL